MDIGEESAHNPCYWLWILWIYSTEDTNMVLEAGAVSGATPMVLSRGAP